MTPGASVTFFRPEFNDFLFAPIGTDRNEMPLSVLSALSRLNIDPWEEAAELSGLPVDTATQRLASMLGRLPGGKWAQVDSTAIADRLIELLPRLGSSKVPVAEKADGRHAMTGFGFALILLCAVLGITAVMFAANRDSSSLDEHPDAPSHNTTSTPQMSVPSSR
jgi:hypothetical protein